MHRGVEGQFDISLLEYKILIHAHNKNEKYPLVYGEESLNNGTLTVYYSEHHIDALGADESDRCLLTAFLIRDTFCPSEACSRSCDRKLKLKPLNIYIISKALTLM